MTSRSKRVYIPNKQQFPQIYSRVNKNDKTTISKTPPISDLVMNNETIDLKKLALLVNVCHLVADVNEQLVMDIINILKDADPKLRLQFERPVRQIKNHAADMVRVVDTKMDSQYSERFGEAADALKEAIMNYVYVNITTNG